MGNFPPDKFQQWQTEISTDEQPSHTSGNFFNPARPVRPVNACCGLKWLRCGTVFSRIRLCVLFPLGSRTLSTEQPRRPVFSSPNPAHYGGFLRCDLAPDHCWLGPLLFLLFDCLLSSLKFSSPLRSMSRADLPAYGYYHIESPTSGIWLWSDTLPLLAVLAS